jgi:hypothetical protein
MPPEDWLIRKPKLRAPPHQKSYLEEKIMSLTCARRPIRNAFRCLLWLALLSLPLLAQAPPSADTFVSSSTAKTNYGSSIALVVGSGTTSYVRFNLAGIPAGASISKATLRLYVDAVAKNGTFDVYQLNSSWAENTLTYNTPPPPLGLSVTNGTGVSITTANWNQFLLIDITALAQGWVNGTIPNNGVALALTSGSSGSFSFDSKESLLTGNGPELEIAFNSGTGPQGPQGPAGPVGPQGPQGVAGAVGPTGPTGATGAQGATGLQGAQGPLGPMGLTGAQGLQGVAGPQGAAGTGFNFRAAFDNTASYAANDVVSYNGSSYVAKVATNPSDPAPDSNPNWSLMAQQGATGPQGAQGLPGLQGPQGLIGAQGLIGPMGLTGLQGPAGPSGTSGYANFSCPSGQSITGFNSASQPVCTAGTGGGGGGGGAQDSDGDGIPDAVDPCPMVANVSYLGGSYCPSVLYDVLTGQVQLGVAVIFTNVSVTAVTGTHLTVAILPGDSSYHDDPIYGSALTMDLGALPAPTVGSRINLYGAVVPGFTPYTLPDGTFAFPPTLAPVAIVLLSSPPPAISTITPAQASVAVGGQTTLMVNATAPFLTDTTVTFAVDDASAATVTPSVAILAGQSSATFTVFGLSPAGSVTITASANGTVITSHVQVVP